MVAEEEQGWSSRGYARAYSLTGIVEAFDSLGGHIGLSEDGRQRTISYPRPLVVVHFDPMFALLVSRAESVEGTPPLDNNGNIAFAIHSPTILFARWTGGERATGKRFKFTVWEEPRKEAGRELASWLTVAPLQ